MSTPGGNLGDLQRQFWSQLLVRAQLKGVFHHSDVKPPGSNVLSAGAGKPKLSFEYKANEGITAVQLYMWHGEKRINMDRLERLREQQRELEAALGAQLYWNPPWPNTKCCSVEYRWEDGGLLDPFERWLELQDRMIDFMDSFVHVFRPLIDRLAE
jgi:hypothetical protein